MKTSGFLLLLIISILPGLSQEVTHGNNDKLLSASDSNEKTRIIIGKDMRVRNRGISILDSLENPDIRIEKYDMPKYYLHDRQEEDNQDRHNHRTGFRGHWTGIEAGFNNYNYLNSMGMPAGIEYMALHSGKSMCFNVNFSQLSLGITKHIGVVTGIGLNWNNYVFAHENNIIIGQNDVIEELLPPAGSTLKKSKFTTLYLNVPAILEFQLPTGEGHTLNIGAGVIGGIKIKSHTKMSFKNDENLKSNSDLNLNLLRGGVTGRIGYENFMIFGTYYLTPWFRENQGPGFYNLEPFEIGIALTFND